MDIISRYFDDPINSQRAVDFIIPPRVTRRTAVFFVHGGGWQNGSRANYHAMALGLAKQGYACASVDYRLNRGPGALADKMEDIRLGYDHFRRYLAERGMRKPTRFVTLGSSAGAHLAGLMSATPPGTHGDSTDALELKWRQPAAMVLVCGPVTFVPWKDIFPGIFGSMKSLMGGPYEDDPQAWKNASIDAHIKPGGPAMLLLGAGDEHIFPNWLTKKTVAKWKRRGVDVKFKIYPNCEHGFFYEIEPRRQQQQAFKDLLAFLARLS